MDLQTKNFVIQQILLGEYFIDYKDQTYIYKSPSPQTTLVGYHKYIQAYKEAIDSGIFLSDEQELELLKSEHLWSDSEEKKLKNLHEIIKTLYSQKQQYKYQSRKLNQVENIIINAQAQLEKLQSVRYMLFNQTARYQALHIMYGFVISQCLRDIKYDLIWPSYDRFEDDYNVELSGFFIKSIFYDNLFPESQIREIARSEPWRSQWKTATKLKTKLFNLNQLDAPRFQLCYWTNIYDSIYDSMDCPPSDIINDDSYLNEWLRIQSEDFEKKCVEHFNESKSSAVINNPKIAGSQEIFIKVDSYSDAQKVYKELNDQQARNKFTLRQRAIYRRGQVKESDMPDTKLELQTQFNQLAKQRAKNK